MHVLTATSATQGSRTGDFCATVEGELVRLPGLVGACLDCGCEGGFAGLSSSKATTTAMVADLPLTRDQLLTAYTRTMQREGRFTGDDEVDDPPDWVRSDAEDHADLAASLPPGTVVDIRRGRLRVRRTPNLPAA